MIMKKNMAITIIALTIVASCAHKSQTDAPSQYVISDSLLRTLQIDTVAKCPLVNTLTLTGKVSYNEENVARIFPLVSGNIDGIKVQLGDYVHAGQTLGVIRSTEMAGFANDLVVA